MYSRRARSELVEANRGIVVMFARRYSFTFGDVQLDDLMMEGAASLLHSAERFDPSKGSHQSAFLIGLQFSSGIEQGRNLDFTEFLDGAVEGELQMMITFWLVI